MLHDLTAVLKASTAKGEQPRPRLLHLHPLRNSVRKYDGSGNLQTTPTKEPKPYNIHHKGHLLPVAVEA
jgi:hypothetical protein